jgi:hypothetical protein
LPNNEIHFYPGSRKMAVFSVRDGRRSPLFLIPAVGGPSAGGTDERMPEQPTTAGRYVIGKIHAYRTPSWLFSQIPWGTKLKDMRARNDVWFQQSNGSWASIKENYKITRDEIQQEHFRLFADLRVPSSWVFNDFGPVAIRYFEDRNSNGRLDGKEQLSGQMIHTTPDDEAATVRGQKFELSESHGCVHIRPEDRARLMGADVFKIGTAFIVHSYAESFPNAGTR